MYYCIRLGFNKTKEPVQTLKPQAKKTKILSVYNMDNTINDTINPTIFIMFQSYRALNIIQNNRYINFHYALMQKKNVSAQ